jgi:steroid delta-isomerase-like uncharacterized protein
LSGGNIAQVDQVFAPAFVNHDVMDGQTPGSAGIKQFVDRFKTAFPDSTVIPDITLSEADKVAIRWTTTGTHRGTFLGVASSGRRILLAGINIFRVQQGQIAEMWGHWPMAETLQQLMPAPPR